MLLPYSFELSVDSGHQFQVNAERRRVANEFEYLAVTSTLGYVCLTQNRVCGLRGRDGIGILLSCFVWWGTCVLLSRKHTAPELKISEARKFLRGDNHPTVEDTCGIYKQGDSKHRESIAVSSKCGRPKGGIQSAE